VVLAGVVMTWIDDIDISVLEAQAEAVVALEAAEAAEVAEADAEL
jgi:hypothetical protein